MIHGTGIRTRCAGEHENKVHVSPVRRIDDSFGALRNARFLKPGAAMRGAG